MIIAQNDSSNRKIVLPQPPVYGIPAKTLSKDKIIYRSYFTFSNFTEMWNSAKMNDLPELPCLPKKRNCMFLFFRMC
jgi:hypothetical protein